MLPHHETAAQHARYFATAAADQQLNDASAERVLRVEGAEGRVPMAAVKRVVEFWPTRAAGLARSPSPHCEARPRRRRPSTAPTRQPRVSGRACIARAATQTRSAGSTARRWPGLGAGRAAAACLAGSRRLRRAHAAGTAEHGADAPAARVGPGLRSTGCHPGTRGQFNGKLLGRFRWPTADRPVRVLSSSTPKTHSTTSRQPAAASARRRRMRVLEAPPRRSHASSTALSSGQPGAVATLGSLVASRMPNHATRGRDRGCGAASPASWTPLGSAILCGTGWQRLNPLKLGVAMDRSR